MSEKNEWKPIASAPKDGTAIWAIGQIYGKPFQYECQWNGIEWYHGFGDGWASLEPSYWMPLPAAPGSTSSAPGDAQDERQPLFWYRPRSDDGYEGPIHNDRIEDVRKQSGAWAPLYPGFVTLPKPLSDLRYHGEFIRGWNQCLREVSASVAAPAAGDALGMQKRLNDLYIALEVCSAELFAQCGHQGRALKCVERANRALAAEQCARAALAAQGER